MAHAPLRTFASRRSLQHAPLGLVRMPCKAQGMRKSDPSLAGWRFEEAPAAPAQEHDRGDRTTHIKPRPARRAGPHCRSHPRHRIPGSDLQLHPVQRLQVSRSNRHFGARFSETEATVYGHLKPHASRLPRPWIWKRRTCRWKTTWIAGRSAGRRTEASLRELYVAGRGAEMTSGVMSGLPRKLFARLNASRPLPPAAVLGRGGSLSRPGRRPQEQSQVRGQTCSRPRLRSRLRLRGVCQGGRCRSRRPRAFIHGGARARESLACAPTSLDAGLLSPGTCAPKPPSSQVGVANEYLKSQLGDLASKAHVESGDFFKWEDPSGGFDVGYD